MLLSPAELTQALKSLNGWQKSHDDKIFKVYAFSSYLNGLAFVQKVALKAEQQDHHPDLLLQWGKVTVTLSTHDARGITNKDIQMAAESEKIYEELT